MEVTSHLFWFQPIPSILDNVDSCYSLKVFFKNTTTAYFKSKIQTNVLSVFSCALTVVDGSKTFLLPDLFPPPPSIPQIPHFFMLHRLFCSYLITARFFTGELWACQVCEREKKKRERKRSTFYR